MSKKAKIVCLCGSTKFKNMMMLIAEQKTLSGEIVLMPNVFIHKRVIIISDEEKEKLDKLHFEKITLCDYVFVLNVDGYIGKSTKAEIDWAESILKPVVYLERLSP